MPAHVIRDLMARDPDVSQQAVVEAIEPPDPEAPPPLRLRGSVQACGRSGRCPSEVDHAFAENMVPACEGLAIDAHSTSHDDLLFGCSTMLTREIGFVSRNWK
jgi:hypothetical protein